MFYRFFHSDEAGGIVLVASGIAAGWGARWLHARLPRGRQEG